MALDRRREYLVWNVLHGIGRPASVLEVTGLYLNYFGSISQAAVLAALERMEGQQTQRDGDGRWRACM